MHERILSVCHALCGLGRAEVGFEVGVRRIQFRPGAAAAGPRQCQAAVRALEQHGSVAIHEVCPRGMHCSACQPCAGLYAASPVIATACKAAPRM